MIKIELVEVQVGVGTAPDGMKIAAFHDPQSGIQIVIPFTPESAKEFAAHLTSSGIAVAGVADLEALRGRPENSDT